MTPAKPSARAWATGLCVLAAFLGFGMIAFWDRGIALLLTLFGLPIAAGVVIGMTESPAPPKRPRCPTCGQELPEQEQQP